MNERVELILSTEEINFLISVLGALPTSQTVMSGMSHMIPMIREQAQVQLRQKAEMATRFHSQPPASINGGDAPTPPA